MGRVSSSSNVAPKEPKQLVALRQRFLSPDQLSDLAQEFSQSSTCKLLLNSKKIITRSSVPQDHKIATLLMATFLNDDHNPLPSEIWLEILNYCDSKSQASFGASCWYFQQIYHTFCQDKIGKTKNAIELWSAETLSSYSFKLGRFALLNNNQTLPSGAPHLQHQVTNQGVQIVSLAGEESLIPSVEPIFFTTTPHWASRADDGRIQVWDPSKPNAPPRLIQAEPGRLEAITCDNGEEFLLLSYAHLVTFWRVATWEQIGPVAAISSPYRLIRHDNRLFLFSRNNNQTRVIECGAPANFRDLSFDSVNLFTLNKQLLNYSVTGTQLRLHNALTGQQVWEREIAGGVLSRHLIEIDDHPHIALQYENEFQILNLASGLEFAQFQINEDSKFLENGKNPILLIPNGNNTRVQWIQDSEVNEYEAIGPWIRTLTGTGDHKGRIHAVLYQNGLLFPNERAFVSIPQISNRHLYSTLLWKGKPAVATLSKRPSYGSYRLTIYNAQEREQIQLSRVTADWETKLRGRQEKNSLLKIVTLSDLTLAIAACEIKISAQESAWGLCVWDLDTREMVGRFETRDLINLDKVQVRRSTKYRYEIHLGDQGGRLVPLLEREKRTLPADAAQPSGLSESRVRLTELLILFGVLAVWRASSKINRWMSTPTVAPQ